MNTPKKKPSWFNEKYSEFITIYDHDDIFPKHIPTPNTNSFIIESVLHLIPNVHEHFVYLNDDFFLGRPTHYSDFFTNDGKIVLPHDYFSYNEESTVEQGKDDILKIQYPKRDTFVGNFRHIPYPCIKSYIQKFHEQYKEYIHWIQTSGTKRLKIGCDVCQKLNLRCPCQHTMVDVQKYTYDNDMAYMKPMKDFQENWVRFLDGKHAIVDRNVDVDAFVSNPPMFYCINDTETNPSKREDYKRNLKHLLHKMYPTTPVFEDDVSS